MEKYKYIIPIIIWCLCIIFLVIYAYPVSSGIVHATSTIYCDGTHDDTQAIQDTLDSQKEVILPEGVCLVGQLDQPTATGFVMNSGNILRGSGTTLKLKDSGNAHIITIPSGTTDIVVRDLILDGNRTNQTAGVHGIRGLGADGVLIENVSIREIASYGIAFQQGTNQRVTINNVTIHNTGADGIDFKNVNDLNNRDIISNVTVTNPGRNQNYSQQAGIDLRGIFTLSNIHVVGLDDDQYGIRFRETGQDTGLGGFYSSLTNFYIDGDGEASVGVYSAAGRTQISNGVVMVESIGVAINDTHVSIDNVSIYGANIGVFLDTTASYSQLGNIRVKDGVLGFKIESDYTSLNGLLAHGNSGAGIEVTSNSTSAIIDGSVFRSNGAANIKNGTGTISGDNYGF